MIEIHLMFEKKNQCGRTISKFSRAKRCRIRGNQGGNFEFFNMRCQWGLTLEHGAANSVAGAVNKQSDPKQNESHLFTLFQGDEEKIRFKITVGSCLNKIVSKNGTLPWKALYRGGGKRRDRICNG